jgi:hypothetical protein
MEPLNEKTKQLLTSWSKWLISIDSLAATGCITGLKTAGEAVSKTGFLFFAAIFSFSLSIIFATLFVFTMAMHSPEPGGAKFTKLWLAKLQFALFVMGLLFVLMWIGFLSKIF